MDTSYRDRFIPGEKPPVSVDVSKSVCNAECVGDHFKADVRELTYKIRFLPHW